MLLYAITDRRLLSGGAEERLVELAGMWAAGGVDYIQVREKDLGAEALCSLTRSIVEAVRAVPGVRTRVLLNVSTPEQWAACAGCGQDGMHLPGGMRLERGATAAGLLSVACHSPEDVKAAREGGADLALFAPVFEKPLEAGAASVLPGSGLGALREACLVAGELPVIALGGVTAANAAGCVRAGAAGVAGIRLFLDASLTGWRALRPGRD